jgi:dUTP pyrophosphatase
MGLMEEKQLNLGEMLDSLSELNGEQFSLEAFASVLALPDEEFKTLSGIILDELNKSLNNPNDRLLLAQSFNAQGITSDEVIANFKELATQIDSIKDDVLPQAKRDFVKQIVGLMVNAIAETEGISKRIIQIPIELCHPNAKIPAYAKPGDAGMDIYALEDFEVAPGERKIIKTGLKVAIPRGYELQVRPRSGTSVKTALRVANTPGTIDSGYRDEIGVIIENIEPEVKDIGYVFDNNGNIIIKSILHGSVFNVGKGERFAQLVLNEVPSAAFYPVDSVAQIGENRGGGFGSTGKK